MILQIIQLIGAILVLLQYWLIQHYKFSPQNSSILLINLFGSFLLFISALLTSNIGFLILNGVWWLITVKEIISKR